MSYVLDFQETDRSQGAVIGGKGANLAELSRLDGIDVPDGFCVTTDGFRRGMAEKPEIDDLLEQLSHVEPDDRDVIRVLSVQIRRVIEESDIPDDLATEIVCSVTRLGEHAAFAVRSSATAEDLPTASFAGQQDTYLNIVGAVAILRHVSRCWGSLFTERAIAYRLKNGFDHRKVHMAVVVQRMVFPQASGILFTADPVTSDRTVATVDAGFGLGEALVSGLVNADVYKVRDGAVVDKTVARKQRAVRAAPKGGTYIQEIEPEWQNRPVLTDAQIVRLAQVGRDIEAHFGCPQDIEWCLVDDGFLIVQSRPITTLFPIPVVDDGENHVYVSVGHQQMMTDPMKPLGISVWQLTSPAPMREAGGRLFVDVTQRLASPASSAALVETLGKSDPLIGDALQTVLDRGDFIRSSADEVPVGAPAGGAPALIDPDPAIVAELIAGSEVSLAAMKRDIVTKSGSELLDFIEADIQELRRILFDPRSGQVITTAMEATRWLSDRLREWLGEKNAADTLTQSVPHNVTSEMGLALLDVADALRPHPDVVAFLRHVEHAGIEDERFLDELEKLTGGPEARATIEGYLDKYGMRCVGEIDITRPRWSDRPTTLVPTIMSNIENFGPGVGKQRFERGLREAEQKEKDLLDRLRALPDGERKAEETKPMIDRVRTFAGYREYPKYAMVGRYFAYKQALLREAGRLVEAHGIREQEDVFYLTFDELRKVVSTHRPCDRLVRERKEAFRSYGTLTPPRVLTSNGEAVSGEYRREDVPAEALAGLPVSAGIVEGRARVISDMSQADLVAGDILVTAYTDPSWTPLFVAIDGLVTEVGGLMTHGAVIAREYGVPAVVGVENATRLIRDGQRIRVNGTDGYVEILPDWSGCRAATGHRVPARDGAWMDAGRTAPLRIPTGQGTDTYWPREPFAARCCTRQGGGRATRVRF
ncbi:rifamycin-inactivating phosphotransferase [Rhodococcus sp. JS3073]|uniref:rifamycin-inactivating phosphotransferase n=1 Tax=Rhodococcus sp. JS3073 TaxID=3002901 RepID=UPI002285CB5F|nr:rifamycin-inactivating phosphotransferase [Rhodococcus sp. JS3073]WAM15247.1 phosphoenolpyruvate synthase [Rhodococcus sp. JS3073]